MKLLSPGIVRSPENVLNALSYQHTFMHRDPEFHEMYFDTGRKLSDMANCSSSTTMFVTGSGTSSMDVVINAIVNHGKTLFVSNGMFGERWNNIGFFYNKYNSLSYKLKWGEAFDVDKIKECVLQHDIKYLVMVHCDTSVGIQNPIEKLKTALPDITFIVDAVSSFGAVDIDMDTSGIDILVTNPNKALASHMGLGIIIGKNKTLDTFDMEKCGSYSLNLRRHYDLGKKGETCNSVSISSLNALKVALDTYERNDYDFLMENTLTMINATNDFSTLLTERKDMCPTVVTIMTPNADDIIKMCKSEGYILYPCKGEYEHKGFQISFYGSDAKLINIIKIFELIKYNMRT